MLAEFMKEFSNELEAPAIAKSTPTGNYLIPLEEGIIITVSPLAVGFTFNTIIGPCPKTHKEEFFSRALLGNLFGQGTRNAILGLNEEGTHLTLANIIDYNVDYKGFKELIEDFINVLDFWREELKSHA